MASGERGPHRTCIGCRRVALADQLIRVVARPGGELALGRHLPGRGAWLCAGSAACIDAADRRRAFSRALRTDITGPEVAALRDCLAGRGRMEKEPAGF
ncbi:MAG: YlxR family protein [Acidimicrobiia bacterium]|nr:YlxR family protein [Acidimicrobiia bacterium]